MNMRRLIAMVEDVAEPDQLGWIIVSGVIGKPLEFKNIPLRNQREGDGGYGHRVEQLRGKKWSEASVSPMRIMKPDVGFVGNHMVTKIEGGIWFFEKDRQEAEAAMKSAVRGLLGEFRNEIDMTLGSLGDR